MYASGKEELAIRGSFHAMACCRKLQILYQLDLSPAGMLVMTIAVINIVTIMRNACNFGSGPS